MQNAPGQAGPKLHSHSLDSLSVSASAERSSQVVPSDVPLKKTRFPWITQSADFACHFV